MLCKSDKPSVIIIVIIIIVDISQFCKTNAGTVLHAAILIFVQPLLTTGS